MKLSYFFRVLSGASFGKIKDAISHVHEKTGKNSVGIFFDMVGCFIKYRAGYNDYMIFEYYNMKADERKTYMTRFKNKKFIEMQNGKGNSEIFDDKSLFYKKFKNYIGREARTVSEMSLDDFKKMVGEKRYFIVKPAHGECGKGIEKLDREKFASLEEMYKYVTDKENNFGVFEDLVIQHPQLNKIYPHSINCLRVVTLVVNGEAHILYAVFKTGNNGHFVDNLESGGFACHFDLDKGVVTGPGHTSKLDIEEYHPATGVKFEGFELPYCEEVKALVKKAALEVKDFNYCGWDVCISENGPAIIEGNDYAAYDFPQLPDPGKPRVGLLAIIKQYMPDLKL